MKIHSRREFIRNVSMAGVVTGTASIPFISSGKPLSRQGKTGIALVGLGYYSRDLLAPALQLTQDCYLAGIVTGTPEKEKIWSEKYFLPKRNIYNYGNFDSIAENKDIDVIYVVLPNSMHREFVVRAAKAGKDVICEKPMALNSAECREMISACRTAGVGLAIGYRLRYEPYTRKIQQLAKEKPWGEISLVNAAAGFYMGRPTTNWKTKAALGGGAIMDMGSYPLQAARYATGLEPVAVTAQRFNPDLAHISEVDETTTFQLEFPGGIVANCLTTFSGTVDYLKVVARKGQYGLEPMQRYNGLHGFSPEGPFDFPVHNQQALQMDAMCRAFRNHEVPLTPGEMGLQDMTIIDAIRESVRKNGQKISLT